MIFFKRIILFLFITASSLHLKAGFYEVRTLYSEKNGYKKIVTLCFDCHGSGTFEENLVQFEAMKVFAEKLRREKQAEELRIKFLVESFSLPVPGYREGFANHLNVLDKYCSSCYKEFNTDFINMVCVEPLKFFGLPFFKFNLDNIELESVEGRHLLSKLEVDGYFNLKNKNISSEKCEILRNIIFKKNTIDLINYYIDNSKKKSALNEVYLYIRKCINLFFNYGFKNDGELFEILFKQSPIKGFVSNGSKAIHKFDKNKVTLNVSRDNKIIHSEFFRTEKDFLTKNIEGDFCLYDWIIEANTLWDIFGKNTSDYDRDEVFFVCVGGLHAQNIYQFLRSLGFSDLEENNNFELKKLTKLVSNEKFFSLLKDTAKKLNINEISELDFLYKKTLNSMDSEVVQSFLYTDKVDSFAKLPAASNLFKLGGCKALKDFLKNNNTHDVVKKILLFNVVDSNLSGYEEEIKLFLKNFVKFQVKDYKFIKRFVARILNWENFNCIEEISSIINSVKIPENDRAWMIFEIIDNEYHQYDEGIKRFLKDKANSIESRLRVVKDIISHGFIDFYNKEFELIFSQESLDLDLFLNNIIEIALGKTPFGKDYAKDFIVQFIININFHANNKFKLIKSILVFNDIFFLEFKDAIKDFLSDQDVNRLTRISILSVITNLNYKFISSFKKEARVAFESSKINRRKRFFKDDFENLKKFKSKI